MLKEYLPVPRRRAGPGPRTEGHDGEEVAGAGVGPPVRLQKSSPFTTHSRQLPRAGPILGTWGVEGGTSPCPSHKAQH